MIAKHWGWLLFGTSWYRKGIIVGLWMMEKGDDLYRYCVERVKD